jgi:hypothetical protein
LEQAFLVSGDRVCGTIRLRILILRCRAEFILLSYGLGISGDFSFSFLFFFGEVLVDFYVELGVRFKDVPSRVPMS